MKKGLTLVAVLAVTLGITTAASGRVQALITGAQIKDGSVESQDIENRTIQPIDLSARAVASLKGDRGPRGFAGARGAAGAPGATGPAGPAGPTGARGPQGFTGSTGSQGPQGVKGDPGAGVNVKGSVATTGDLPAGAAAGDSYIVTATGHLHVWSGTAWVDTGLVQGPQGIQGPQGTQGPQGIQGPQGTPGTPGAPGAAGADGGLAGYEIVNGALVPITGADFNVTRTVNCPGVKLAIGGGVTVGTPANPLVMMESKPTVGGTGWTVTMFNLVDANNSFTPHAICANPA